MASVEDGGGGAGVSPVTVELSNAQAWANDQIPYSLGGSGSKATNFLADCSSFVSAIFSEMGYSVGGYNGTSHGPTTYAQVDYGQRIGTSSSSSGSSSLLAKAKAGDVLFFTVAGEGTNAHEAIYAGNGMMYDEPEPGMTAQLIKVPDSASEYVDDIQQYLSASGTPLGSGISYTGTDLPGPSGTSAANSSGWDVGAGTTGTSGGGGSSSGSLLNKSMLVRVGIGLFAVLLLFVGIDQVTKQGQHTTVQLPPGGRTPAGPSAEDGPGVPAEAAEAAE
jgi:NlpC/P60 family